MQRNQNKFHPKGGIFCENIFLKLMIDSQLLLIKKMSLIRGRQGKNRIKLDNAINPFRRICYLCGKEYFAVDG